VTGAAGFIGSHLCRRLVADGHEVVGFDDLSEGDAQKNLADVPEVRLEVSDLLDAEALARAAEGCNSILHQAARKSVPRSVREPDAFVDVNVRGTLNVLLAARDAGCSVVYASSSSVYGHQEVNVYGPYQDPASDYAAVVPRFATACLHGGTPVVYGDGEQARDFTYIDDVVDANVLAAQVPERARGSVFNIGGGREPTSVIRLLELVAEAAGDAPEPRFEPPREGDVRRSHADVSRARVALGYEPKIAIDEGVRRTVEWFASREV
jgi:UDP-glucose 4-epimerase